MQQVDGLCVSINPTRPLVALLTPPFWDEEWTQRAERINGAMICPTCECVIPFVEAVEEWCKGPIPGRWYAAEWGPGFAACSECDCVYAETFEGVVRLGFDRPER